LDLILDINYFSFSSCNINTNSTHLAKHQILNPNHKFSQRIVYVECCSVHACAYGVKSEISQVRNFAWHRWFSLQRCCKPFCFVCFYWPALCRMFVFVLWTSCLRVKIHYYYMWPFAKKLYHGWISTMTSSN